MCWPCRSPRTQAEQIELMKQSSGVSDANQTITARVGILEEKDNRQNRRKEEEPSADNF